MSNNHTAETQAWLDQRFTAADARGIYIAHQPIYGFRNGPCEPSQVERYTITYQIMQALNCLPFTSLVDIGGAEGYKAALARELFGVTTRSADLSHEACNRARELYDVQGDVIDIHALPYPDRSFDVVLCSETLEHVVDLRHATKELMRVAKHAVVITVPREPEEVVRKNIAQRLPHAHIHALDIHSFDFVQTQGWSSISRRMNSRWLAVIREIIEAQSRVGREGKYPQFLYEVYNRAVPHFRRLFGPRSVQASIKIDDWLANGTDSYQGMCFILLRPGVHLLEKPRRTISADDILNFTVPYLQMAPK